MATSSTSICNSALDLLGVEAIASLTEDSKQGRLCNRLYDEVKDNLLRNFTWNFSVGRVELAQVDSTPLFDWAYKYQLPSDCLRVVSLYQDDPFVVEGRYLLSNYSSAYILYIKKITDVSQFDATFTTAMIYTLAARMAYPLVGSRNLAADLFALAEKEIRESRGLDSKEAMNTYAGDDYFINARFGGLYD